MSEAKVAMGKLWAEREPAPAPKVKKVAGKPKRVKAPPKPSGKVKGPPKRVPKKK